MIILGLTGSIGMGKSTAAKMLAAMGCAVHCSDEAVHALLGPGGAAVKKVARIFPTSLRGDRIDRKRLGREVFGDPAKLRRLEAIVHPLVTRARERFLRQARREKFAVAVLDIPLLFETGLDQVCDATLCVTAPRAVQKERVLKRKGMSAEKFRAVLTQQLPDREKRARADYVVRSDRGRAAMRAALKEVLWELGCGVCGTRPFPVPSRKRRGLDGDV